MGFGIYEQMGRTPDEPECPACGLTERIHNQRVEALERVRLEINALDTEIADLLLQRLAKGRYARYLHPEYLDDYTRELQVMARYTKKLCPYTSKETVAELCMTLFRMSRKP
jgi:chorismate mutase